ncbi:MAG: translation initiation factor IF-3 [Gammaproteobacteria bacterium]|nr:translation initiation factor IF-3 [Gammaproteobacteria bacterium]
MAANKRVRRNDEIDAREIRVIGSGGEQVGILSREAALQMAQDAAMDLVEISPTAVPPVCRIMDFGKFLFETNKKAHAAKRKQKQIQVKEVKFRPGTEEGDYQIKLRNLLKFLGSGDKAKVTLRFRGREMAHQEIGARLLQRVRQDLESVGTVEQFPRLEGRQMVMVIAPKKK